jgi:hypothetical protein
VWPDEAWYEGEFHEEKQHGQAPSVTSYHGRELIRGAVQAGAAAWEGEGDMEGWELV